MFKTLVKRERKMSINIEMKEKEERKDLRKNLLNKIKNIKFLLGILEKEIENDSYDKIADSMASLNTSISSFLDNLKKL